MATCTFRGGTDSHWDDNTNWLLGAKPTAADDAVFDASSPSCLIDAAGVCLTINCTGYTNTLTQGANLTVSGSITFVAGMTFTPSTYTAIVNAVSTITSGGKEFYNFSFAGASGLTYTLGSDLTVTNTLDFNASGGGSNLTINGYTIYAQGDVKETDNGIVAGTTALHFTGSNNQIFSFTGPLSSGFSFRLPITINKSANTLTLSGALPIYGNWTYTAGTVSAGTSEVILCCATAQTINDGTTQFYKFTIDTQYGATITLSSDVYITNVLDLHKSAGINNTINGNKLYASGDVQYTATTGSLSGTTTLEFTGNVAQAWSCGLTSDSFGIVIPIVINKSGSTLTLSGTIRLSWPTASGGSITYTAGTVDAGTSTIQIQNTYTLNTNGMSWYAITMGANITLGSNLTLTNNWTRTAGTLSGNYSIVFNGTSSVSGATSFYGLTANSGTIVRLYSTQTTTVTGAFAAIGTSALPIWLVSTTAASDAALNITPASTVYYVSASDIDSALSPTVIDIAGKVQSCINWALINYTGNFTDTQTFSDLIAKSESKNLTDTQSQSDSITKRTSKFPIDTQSFTEVFLRGCGRIFTDTQTITDSIIKTTKKDFTDTQTITDTITKGIALLYNDLISLLDNLVRGQRRTVTDTVTLADSVTSLRSCYKNFLDTLLLSDSISKGHSKNLTDTTGLSDLLFYYQYNSWKSSTWTEATTSSSDWLKKD